VLHDGRILLVTGEVVGFGAAAYRYWIEIINGTVSLLDHLDREGPYIHLTRTSQHFPQLPNKTSHTPDREGNDAYVDARDTGCAFGYETGLHAWGTSLVPERFDAVVESSEYCCEYISPVIGVGRVRTGCRRVWWRVKVLTSVVIIWVAVPATVSRSASLVLLGVTSSAP